MEQHELEQWAQAVAAALRAERGVAGISQAEVERRTGITRTSYRLYEMGIRNPDITQLAHIAEAFGISFSRLMAAIEQRAELAATQAERLTLAAHTDPTPTDRERFEAEHGDHIA